MSHPFFAAPKLSTAKPSSHTAYQVDYAALNCGKIIAASKRRIRFKFGYTNAEALSNGKTGQECRGSEHEVIVTWSLSSGKQAIAFDQHEVFFDVGVSTQTKFSHTWKDQNGHILEVKVHAANMSTKANPDPDWKQYDLLVDGVSIFCMPKIFEIGIVAKENVADNYRVAPTFAQYSPSTSPAQTGQFGDGSNNNMGSILPPAEAKKPEPEPVDLLSFDECDAPAVIAAPPAPVPAQFQQDYVPAPHQFAAPANSQTQVQNQGWSNNISPTVIPGTAQDQSAFYQHAAPSYAAPTPTASYSSQPTPVTPPRSSTALVPSHNSSAKKPVMNHFNAAPAYQQQQGMYNGYVQHPQQPQYNTSSQQPFVQSGFGYQ